MPGLNWFAVQRLREGVFLVGEPMHVNSYLIVGSKRAVLFDTGMGIQNIRRCIEELTPTPVLVVNSHFHFDHVGGNHLFSDIAIHESGAKSLEQGPPDFWFPSYLEFVDTVLAEYRTFRGIDEQWFQVLGIEQQMRNLPDEFNRDTWRTVPTIPTQLLRDGDTLDLGDRTLTVIHTPGHSQDGICLLDERNRILFSGDTIDTGPLYAHLPESDINAFGKSTRRLVDQYISKVDILLSAHGARYQSYPDLARRVADAFVELQSGDASLTETADCFGSKALEARFNDFSIVVPADYPVR